MSVAVESAGSDVPANLCDACTGLCSGLFVENGLLDIPRGGRKLVSLGRRPSELGKVACSLCQIFWRHATEYFRKYRYQVRLFNRLADDGALIPAAFLAVVRENSRLTFDLRIGHEIGQMGLLICRSVSDLQPAVTIDFDPTAVNFEPIKHWLNDCLGNHDRAVHTSSTESTASTTKKSVALYFIDCTDECIVQDNGNMSFLALSYVWGRKSSDASHVTHAAHISRQQRDFCGPLALSEMPLTIRDAVEATRKLGRRYLWVDRCCIHPDAHAETIAYMDNIYSKADATIVALHGEDDGAGLPGVSTVARFPQDHVRFGGGILHSSCPPISTLINKSKWNERGWTFQEARLSQRCIFFTQHQVYFVCESGVQSEMMADCQIKARRWPSYLLNSSRLDYAHADIFSNEVPRGLEGRFLDRHVYSQKDLSFQEDALNAFRGILARCPFLSLWGIPVFPKTSHDLKLVNVFFTFGLLWVRSSPWFRSQHLKSRDARPAVRRPGFPTWSWSSITGEVNQAFPHESAVLEETDPAQYSDGHKFLLSSCRDCPRFEMFDGHTYTELDKIIRQWVASGRPDWYPLHEPEPPAPLIVEGYVVRDFSRIPGHTSPNVLSHQFDLDEDTYYSGLPGGNRRSPPRLDGKLLVMGQWQNASRRGKWWLVMMVLRWIDDDHAERRGIVTTSGLKGERVELSKSIAEMRRFRLS